MDDKTQSLEVSSQIDVRIQWNPIKIPTGIFVEICKLIVKYMWKRKGLRIVKTMF